MTRERLVVTAPRTFACAYLFIRQQNPVGCFDGDAMMIASNGELLESSPQFSYADFTLTTAVVDIETNHESFLH
jgi:NAD+ synthase (glutamine-hydrolysing)